MLVGQRPVQMFYTAVPTAVKETFQSAREEGRKKRDGVSAVSSALLPSMCPCPFIHKLIKRPSSDVPAWSSERTAQITADQMK